MSVVLRELEVGAKFHVCPRRGYSRPDRPTNWTLVVVAGDVAWAKRHAPGEPMTWAGPVGHAQQDRFAADIRVHPGWSGVLSERE